MIESPQKLESGLVKHLHTDDLYAQHMAEDCLSLNKKAEHR